jgi:hypothetical protein
MPGLAWVPVSPAGGGWGAHCCLGEGVPSWLEICIPADFYFRPCLFVLKTQSHTRISCECVILQLLPGCFCDLGNNEGKINKQHSIARRPLCPSGKRPVPSLSPSHQPLRSLQAQKLGSGWLKGAGALALKSSCPCLPKQAHPLGTAPPTTGLLILPSTKANKGLA